MFRDECGRIIATLIRMTGDFELAEDAMQDACAKALDRWPAEGLPENPAAWIATTARRNAVDRIRRQHVRRAASANLDSLPSNHETVIEQLQRQSETHFGDDRLRLIFTCCHPSLNQEAQIALTLRTLGGLKTEEIARAFLVPHPTMSQRLLRAKRKIKDARIPYEIPSQRQLPQRVDSVLAVLYLVFNEGYTASAGDHVVRMDLTAEAIRLARVLVELMPDEPEAIGLLCLMLFHDSRREARMSADGKMILLEDQDRARWDHAQIAEACALLDGAQKIDSRGPYVIQAEIARVHATAESPGETHWPNVVSLYEELMSIVPNEVVKLNHAVAVGMAEGFERGLELIDALGAEDELDAYLFYHSARGDFLRRLNRLRESLDSYRRALDLAGSTPEREFLQCRIADLESRASDL